MNKIVLVIIMIGQFTFSFSQMKVGNYPFNVVDSLVFTNQNDLLQVKLNCKPNNFISTMEAFYIKYQDVVDETEMYKEYSKEIHKKTNERDFIAGFTNYSNDTIFVPINDEIVTAILEAKDKKGEWKPIQYHLKNGCGTGFHYQYVLPGQSLQFTVKNDYGTIQTLLRLKLHCADTIYISKSFKGSIDEQMFYYEDPAEKNRHYSSMYSAYFLDSVIYGKPFIGDYEFDLIFEEE